MEHRSAQASRNANVTYHLVPEPVWSERGGAEMYLPEAYEADGFIHLTNGLDELVKVANMFYTSDDRDYLVLALDMNRISSEVRYDDPDNVYPHVYGPLNTDAVLGTFTAERGADGTFTEFRKA